MRNREYSLQLREMNKLRIVAKGAKLLALLELAWMSGEVALLGGVLKDNMPWHDERANPIWVHRVIMTGLKLLEELAELREWFLLFRTQVCPSNVVLPVVGAILGIAIWVEFQILGPHPVKIDIIIIVSTSRHKTRWQLVLDFDIVLYYDFWPFRAVFRDTLQTGQSEYRNGIVVTPVVA